MRVVFDTGTVVSALLFPHGRLAWLRGHWARRDCVALLSSATAEELMRVLGYPKFRLSAEDRYELLAEYIPLCETVVVRRRSPVTCRDAHDQVFLDLAQCGRAEVLVSGDRDLLALRGRVRFAIETAAEYRARFGTD